MGCDEIGSDFTFLNFLVPGYFFPQGKTLSTAKAEIIFVIWLILMDMDMDIGHGCAK